MKENNKNDQNNQIPTTLIGNVLETIKSKANELIEYRKNQIIESGTKYATAKLVKSEFAKENVTAFQTMIMTIVLRFIMGVLIFNRFQHGNPIVDMIISVAITVGCQLVSPTFYAIAETQAPMYMKATNNFLNNILDENVNVNYNYLLRWKNKIMLFIAFLGVIFLAIVEINSRYLIECIISSVLAGIVCNYIEQVNQHDPALKKYELISIRRDEIEQPQIIDDYAPLISVNNNQNNVTMQKNTNGNNISININNSSINISEPLIRKICSFEILEDSYIQSPKLHNSKRIELLK